MLQPELSLGIDQRCRPAVHPSRGLVAYASGFFAVVWDWRASEQRRLLHARINCRITSLAFSADGRFLAVAAGPRIEVWDLSDGLSSAARGAGACVLNSGHVRDAPPPSSSSSASPGAGTGGVTTTVCFSGDGSTIVTLDAAGSGGGGDTWVCLWDWGGGRRPGVPWALVDRAHIKPLPPSDISSFPSSSSGAAPEGKRDDEFHGGPAGGGSRAAPRGPLANDNRIIWRGDSSFTLFVAGRVELWDLAPGPRLAFQTVVRMPGGEGGGAGAGSCRAIDADFHAPTGLHFLLVPAAGTMTTAAAGSGMGAYGNGDGRPVWLDRNCDATQPHHARLPPRAAACHVDAAVLSQPTIAAVLARGAREVAPTLWARPRQVAVIGT